MSMQRTMKRAPKRDLDADLLSTKKFHGSKRGKREYRVAIATAVYAARKPKFTGRKYQKEVVKLGAKARFVSGLLIRATGQAAPLVTEVKLPDAYHQRIFERGTTITPAHASP